MPPRAATAALLEATGLSRRIDHLGVRHNMWEVVREPTRSIAPVDQEVGGLVFTGVADLIAHAHQLRPFDRDLWVTMGINQGLIVLGHIFT